MTVRPLAAGNSAAASEHGLTSPSVCGDEMFGHIATRHETFQLAAKKHKDAAPSVRLATQSASKSTRLGCNLWIFSAVCPIRGAKMPLRRAAKLSHLIVHEPDTQPT